jgi:O-antigen ligase
LFLVVAAEALASASKNVKFTTQSIASASWIWELGSEKCPTPLIRNVSANAMRKQVTMKYIYSIILLLILFFTWRLLYNAQTLEYDDNYASIILAFLISLCAFIPLIFLWFKKREFIKQNIVLTIIYLIFNSPFSIAFAIIYYGSLFGPLKV